MRKDNHGSSAPLVFTFQKGVASLAGFPPDRGNEVVFAGRSNSGKSSVINALIGQRLARVSKIPGRTREINFFSSCSGGRLVDIPGYGFARVSAKQKRSWQVLLEGYFAERRSLAGIILIMDVRRPLQEGDQRMLSLRRTRRIPTCILLNKADKISRAAGLMVLEQVRNALGEEGVPVQLFSARKGQGQEAARVILRRWLFGDVRLPESKKG